MSLEERAWGIPRNKGKNIRVAIVMPVESSSASSTSSKETVETESGLGESYESIDQVIKRKKTGVRRWILDTGCGNDLVGEDEIQEETLETQGKPNAW